MRLSKRLYAVASFVRKGSLVADIGTDHGYIPIYLAEKGICDRIIAMDIRKGPLMRARENIRERGLGEKIEVRLSDGFAALKPKEADTAIIAGMGGELIIHILENGRHLWKSLSEMVLSPQSEPGKVREYLDRQGFFIDREEMVLDEGKFYPIMLVKKGQMNYENQAQYLYGKRLIEEKSPVLAIFLEKERERINKILQKLEGENSSKSDQARQDLEKQLVWIKEAQDEMQRYY